MAQRLSSIFEESDWKELQTLAVNPATTLRQVQMFIAGRSGQKCDVNKAVRSIDQLIKRAVMAVCEKQETEYENDIGEKSPLAIAAHERIAPKFKHLVTQAKKPVMLSLADSLADEFEDIADLLA